MLIIIVYTHDVGGVRAMITSFWEVHVPLRDHETGLGGFFMSASGLEVE